MRKRELIMNRLRKEGFEDLRVQFVSDEDVLEHIIDKQEVAVTRSRNHENKTAINVKTFLKKNENTFQGVDEDVLTEQDYVDVLGTDVQDPQKAGPFVGGGNVYSFQAVKRSHKMAQLATELARTPGKSVTFSTADTPTEAVTPPPSGKKLATSNKTLSKGKKNEFVSTTPHRLRKRLTAPDLRSESESDYSASSSESESTEERDEVMTNKKTPNKATAMPVPNKPPTTPVSSKTPSKKSKQVAAAQLVEEYFEAHSSSKVLTSDRTLQRLQTPKLDQETLRNLLENAAPAFSEELKHLNQKHEELFYKWMLQLHLGFNIILFGLGSKRSLLDKFRTTLLQDSAHIVINGFFPSITVKSILNSITEEVLDHLGTFRNPMDQLDFILKEFRKGASMDLYLIIHNIDSQMLRGDKTQQVIGQLASAPNIHLIASIDHINAPLMWDQSKQSLYNWLWYETTTYSPYLEETSYENSLLVKQSGALALSSLTHVLRSLTPNARGIFRLLADYQLANQDNPSFPGLSFQDFYQQCREAFLVNSDLTLRAQLTEFRDHKLIRTKKGADGVEYLSIPVDHGTLSDFLEKEDSEV